MTRSAKRFLWEQAEEFRARLLEEAVRLAGDVPVENGHLEQALAILMSKAPSTDWSVANRRRVYLIRKEISGKISSSELPELEKLQAEADCHVSEIAPRPLEELWDLKEELLRRKPDADGGGRK